MAVKIAPSILSADFSRLGQEMKRVEEAGADLFHIDVMDGHFVPNITIGPCVVKSIRPVTKLPFDVHLMIKNPIDYVKDFSDAGADFLTFHYECESCVEECIKKARDMGLKPGLSINPPTPIDKALPFLEKIDMLLVMSVNPGFAGQGFMPEAIPKIRKAREYIEREGLSTVIEVDGGISDKTFQQVVNAGADYLVAGSYLFKGEGMADKIRLLKGE
ncbi:MAG: ribulose-phosphate 3-epimerase [Candidatus Thermoplasmatota archaeon]|nr:ribulose-phosphate 3-epimerase [Candidatus Thermoplasmatota archaeon]